MSKTKGPNIDLKLIKNSIDVINGTISIGFTALTDTIRDSDMEFDKTLADGWLLINKCLRDGIRIED